MSASASDSRSLPTWGVLALVACVFTGVLVRPPEAVRLDVGGPSGDFLGDGWSDSDRTDLNLEAKALAPATADPGGLFRFRAARPGAALRLPIVSNGGAMRMAIHAMARVRTTVSMHAVGRSAGSLSVSRGPWATHVVELDKGVLGDAFELSLALHATPMVRVPDAYVAQPELWVASIEARSPSGLRFTPGGRLLLALVPLLIFAFAVAAGLTGRTAFAAASVGALSTLGLARAAPLASLLAIPRLLLPALLVGLAVSLGLARRRDVPRRDAACLASLVAAGIALHGSLAFIPGFDPYDVEVHVRRALDLGTLPFDYASLLRYGSHLPTPSQTFGTATAALGEQTLIPYSPLPYFAYYALHLVGIDLHWGMTVLNAAVAMAVAPLLWLLAHKLWSTGAAWLAALLYAFDLPVWHHLGRSHAPAVFGNALGVAAIAYLASQTAELGDRKRSAIAAVVLGLASLGYSSLLVLFGFFGLALLGVLAFDAAGIATPARRGLRTALVAGGLISGVLFYFHYVPGVIAGLSSVQGGPDLFPGRSYLIFHNESRQSMRIWDAGFLLPLALGLLAAPLALRRAQASARPVLVAWLLAWALTMLAKEPFLFPRPLRWAKEEQFVSPLVALFIGAAAWGLPRAWQRWTAGTVLVLVALWLECGDFARHATGLMP